MSNLSSNPISYPGIEPRPYSIQICYSNCNYPSTSSTCTKTHW